MLSGIGPRVQKSYPDRASDLAVPGRRKELICRYHIRQSQPAVCCFRSETFSLCCHCLTRQSRIPRHVPTSDARVCDFLVFIITITPLSKFTLPTTHLLPFSRCCTRPALDWCEPSCDSLVTLCRTSSLSSRLIPLLSRYPLPPCHSCLITCSVSTTTSVPQHL